ncbi:MAG TPA: hypothetical protein VJX67_25500, partial [Blastocatellia bacterium]|nr:hypothetical protein [Blastocatellia bacterium]
PVNTHRLLQSARAGGDYLVRMQRPDGSFVYSYRAALDTGSTARYNIVRHAGAAISLFDLYGATHDRRYLNAARKAVDFLHGRFHETVVAVPHSEAAYEALGPNRSRTGLYVTDDDGKAKLGAMALSLLAEVDEIKYLGRRDLTQAEALANVIMAMQNEDGSFRTTFNSGANEPDDPPSLYFPGEAMLALTELYQLIPRHDPRLLDTAERGAGFLIRAQREQTDLPPDAWFAQSLEALYRITHKSEYARHAIALAVSMVKGQYSVGAPEGYEGGVTGGIPRAVQSASRAEGVLAGYRLAIILKDATSWTLLAGLKSSAGFQLSQQFTSGSSFFLPAPERALGGFRESFSSTRIRIDYVQHNIESLLGLAAALEEK